MWPVLVDQGGDSVIGDVGCKQKKRDSDGFFGALSVVGDKVRVPVNRQMTITLAKPSITESSPKPNRATEPATTAATRATNPSAAM
jgi:hypothetical protein